MPTTLHQISKDGSLIVDDVVDERLPSVTSGLVAHYPLDGKSGTVDIISGDTALYSPETNVNIIEALNESWKDPANWSGSGVVWDEVEEAIRFDTPNTERTLVGFIPIQTNKHYYLRFDMRQGPSADGIIYAGTKSYDTNKTFLAGHPGTYDYFVRVGQALTTSWVSYNNNEIGGEFGPGKTGEDANTGNYAAFHPGTKYVKIMFLNNYAGTVGPTYLRDLIFYTNDTDTSNLVESYDGISVQEATTNLVLSPAVTVYSPFSGFVGTSTAFVSPSGSIGTVLIGKVGGGCQWQGGVNNIAISPSTVYTVSSRIKATNYGLVSGNFFYIRQYNGGSQTSEGGKFNSANMRDLNNGYYLAYATFTTDATANTLTIQSYEYAANISISAYDLQLERRAFATPFITGSVGAGNLKIPIPAEIKTFPFSATVKIENLLTGGQVGEGGEPSVGYPFSWWQIAGGYAGILHQVGRSNSFFQLRDFRVTIIFRATTFDIYYNNTLITNNSAYYLGITPALTLPFSLGTRNGEEVTGRFNGLYSNFSVYNKQLTTTEINTLVNSTSSSSQSLFVVNKVEEYPNFPDNSYYFPLTENSSDITGTILSLSPNGLAYEDSAIWVGTATTNFTNLTLFGGNSLSLGNSIYRFTNQQYRNAGVSGLVASSNCTTSWRLKGIVTGQTIRVSTEGASSGNGYDLTTLSRYSKTYKKTIVCSAAGYFSPLLYQFTGDNNNLSDLYIESVQVENKIFGSPYVLGSRPASYLVYNFNASIGLDWAGDWSICYWKKPVGTHTDGFDGYSIESLGANSNTVGGGYIWWGKDNGSNTISQATPSTFVVSDYFDKWHMVSLVRSGTTVTITTWSVGNQTHVRTVGYSTANTNYMVNQYGYDFKLGGWDNNNPTNAFFRDLVVTKYALSATQLGLIYNQSSLSPAGVKLKILIEKGV
jgi:hypothetical protein